MHRTEGDGYVTGQPWSGPPTAKFYADENPPTRDATQLRHEEMNAIQEEIANVIIAEGYTLQADTETYAQMHQLNTAINWKLKTGRIENQSTVVGSYLTAALDALKTADTAEAVIRDANDKADNGELSSTHLDTLINRLFATPTNLLTTMSKVIGARRTGLRFSRLASPSHGDVSIAPGIALAGSTDLIQLQTQFRKDIEASWSAGDYAGGRAGVLTDATWYHLFVIRKSSTGAVDAGFSIDPYAADLLSASTYDEYVRIGSVYYIDSTDKIKDFVNIGNTFRWTEPYIIEAASLGIAAAPTVTTVPIAGIPPDIDCHAIMEVVGNVASGTFRQYFWGNALGATVAVPYIKGHSIAGVTGVQSIGTFELLMEKYASVGGANVYFTEVAAGSSLLSLGSLGWREIDDKMTV